MRTDRIEIRVFIEGVRVKNVSSVFVQQFANEASQASVTMPPPPGFKYENLKRARVHIFYSDIEIRSRRSEDEWPLLFEGEITGDTYTKGVSSRDISFNCSGYNTYWEQVLLYYWNPASSSILEATYSGDMKSFLGNKDTQENLNVNVTGARLQDRLIETFSKEVENGKPYYSTVKAVFSSALTVNYFFELQNARLKLGSRFASVKDENLDLLVGRKYVMDILENDVTAVSGRISMMELMKRILSVFRYQIICNTRPQRISNVKKDELRSKRTERQIQYQTQIILQQIDSFLVKKNLNTLEFYGISFSGSLSDDEILAMSKQFADEEVAAERPTARTGSEDKEASTAESEFYDELVKQRDRLKSIESVTTPNVKNLDTSDGVTDLLTQYMLLPDTKFASIPRCNTIFPQDQTSISLNRQLLMEPTRSITTTHAVANTPQKLYYAPRQIGEAKVPERKYAPTNTEGFSIPILGKWRISSGYGPRQIKKKVQVGTDPQGNAIYDVKHPHGTRFHRGVDVASFAGEAILGKEIHAFDDGEVRVSGWQNPENVYVGYGLRVFINHESGLQTRYAHMKESFVKKGDIVKKGQVIGTVGGDKKLAPSGSSTGAHLHFEIRTRVGGNALDPKPFLEKAGNLTINERGHPKYNATPKSDNSATGTTSAEPVTADAEKIKDGMKSKEGVFSDYKYLTPEEERSGIVPYFDDTTVRNHALFAVKPEGQQDLLDDYIQQIVESEFLWARYSTRSIQALNMPFNPEPCAGFPGLIVDKVRSIVGMINSVGHQISVGGGGGNASTIVSMQAPRYYDEGDPYYWANGQDVIDDKGRVDTNFATFPVYYQAGLVHTNSVEANLHSEDEIKGLEGLMNSSPQSTDDFYQSLLGCNAVPYQFGLTQNDALGIDVAYNKAIDNPDRKSNENSPNTIMGHYYNLLKSNPRDAESYVKRFTRRESVNERELMEILEASLDNTGLNYVNSAAGGPFNNDIQTQVRDLVGRLRTVNRG